MAKPLRCQIRIEKLVYMFKNLLRNSITQYVIFNCDKFFPAVIRGCLFILNWFIQARCFVFFYVGCIILILR